MHKPAPESRESITYLPDKLFYRIGDACKIVGVKPHILRYWETEFPFLKPRKNKSGQRVYVKRDIEFLLRVRRLLYQDRYTIEGVKKKLSGISIRSDNSDVRTGETQNLSEVISHVKKSLKLILTRLK